ncbi:hypothetical protein FTUN_4832 [Frigoriglobus tundricola]|uniref:Uncharacterized protein n=1 Tax=Frigoriglobus tundricola TaxID=2774151 RepID=A0A6M5YWF6_9BACT|nr:hypothetical protein FTUN_4832 [Frigoriglobus tundricola]
MFLLTGRTGCPDRYQIGTPNVTFAQPPVLSPKAVIGQVLLPAGTATAGLAAAHPLSADDTG